MVYAEGTSLALLPVAMIHDRPALPAQLAQRGLSPRRRRSLGFTVIELMTVVTVMGALSLMAVARTKYTIEQARIAKAIGDVRAISNDIMGYQTSATGQALPASLATIDRDGLMDPWTHPYVYVVLGGSGSPRVDVFGVRLNSDFDIYSQGPDGSSSLSLVAPNSQDDIVRGADGGFIGRASRY
jgi:general secretion pathway protein G